MTAWARLVTDCRKAGVQRTVRLTDALIAATAIAHGLPVVDLVEAEQVGKRALAVDVKYVMCASQRGRLWVPTQPD